MLKDASNEVLPSGTAAVHYNVYSKSMEVMSGTLRRNIYGLCAPGFPIEQVQQPDPDPLVKAGYALKIISY